MGAGGGEALGDEGGDEGVLEIEDLGEVLAAVGILFAEDLFLDQVENHVADVLALSHAPFTHESGGHGAELLEREIPIPRQQLGTAHMTRLAAIVLGNALESEVQRVLQKEVGMRIKALVAFQNGNDGLFELHGLHEVTMQKGVGLVKELSPERGYAFGEGGD